jgi:hypothetical protein
MQFRALKRDLRPHAENVAACSNSESGQMVATKRQTRAVPATLNRQLPNHELVVLAAYLAGAQSTSADTEDIAIKANILAPGRFSWRKYKDQINIDTVRKRLWDATKVEKGGYLIGSEKQGWRLTKAGFDFAHREIAGSSLEPPRKTRVSQIERTAKTRETKRMISEVAFVKFSRGQNAEITKADAERFFRIDDYVTGKARAAKIERFRIITSDNLALTTAIDFFASLVKE